MSDPTAPRNPGEEQAMKDYLESSLTGTDSVENLMAGTEARTLEQRYGLGSDPGDNIDYGRNG